MSMRRQMMRRAKDRNIFRRTAVKSKVVNVVPLSMRGGIRL